MNGSKPSLQLVRGAAGVGEAKEADLEDGNTAWSHEFGSETEGAPTLDDDALDLLVGPVDERRGAERYALVEPVDADVELPAGETFRAFDRRLQCAVELQVLGPSTPLCGVPDPAAVQLGRDIEVLRRLSHPALRRVHELTVFRGHDCLVLEPSCRVPLRVHLERERPGWAAIVAGFVELAEGCGVLHRAGFRHLAIAPESIAVDERGRLRLVDYGLVRRRARHWVSPLSMVREDEVQQIAYSAPELLLEADAGASADLWSLAAVLYDALYGWPPYVVGDVRDSVTAAARGLLPASPSTSTVPAAVYEVLARALDPLPGNRPPCVTALAEALAGVGARRSVRSMFDVDFAAVGSRARGTAVPWAAAAACVVTLTFGVHTWWASSRARAECAAGGSPVAWRPDARGEIREAFVGTGLPGAAALFERTDAGVDAWLSARSKVVDDACDGARAPTVLGCLAEQDARVQALGAVLRRADAEAVRRSVAAIASLPDPGGCREAGATPISAAERERLAQLDAWTALGRAAAANSAASSIVAAEAALSSAELARIHAARGRARLELGDLANAELDLRTAIEAAGTGGRADLAAEAWNDLLRTVGARGRIDEALGLRTAVELAVSAAGDRPIHRARVLVTLAGLEAQAGRHDAARRSIEAELPGLVRELGELDPALAGLRRELGRALLRTAEPAAAADAFALAVAHAEALHGPGHRELVDLRRDHGDALAAAGRTTEARAAWDAALRLCEQLGDRDGEQARALKRLLGGAAADPVASGEPTTTVR